MQIQLLHDHQIPATLHTACVQSHGCIRAAPCIGGRGYDYSFFQGCLEHEQDMLHLGLFHLASSVVSLALDLCMEHVSTTDYAGTIWVVYV